MAAGNNPLLQTTLDEIKEKFDEQTSTTELMAQLRTNNVLIDGCVGRCWQRRKNRLQCMNNDITAECARRRRKRDVYDFLTSDLKNALDMADREMRVEKRKEYLLRQSIRGSGRTMDVDDEAREQERKDRQMAQVRDAQTVFQDLVLVDGGKGMQDARSIVDDMCPNCGTAMHRNLLNSCLVCPRLDCQFMRTYIDTSVYSGNTYSQRDSSSKSSSNVTHYASFLNNAQGRTSRKLSSELLLKICYFLRVQGITQKKDITKKTVNKAQKFFMTKNEYNISVIVGAKLRGDSFRIPPEVIKKMHLLFRAIGPVFFCFKKVLEPRRRNMANFDFISRVMVRLLGYDVFLPLFTTFDLRSNTIRHYAFMRRLFRIMKWEWCEALSDEPDSVLDEFDARNHEEIEGLLSNLDVANLV